MNTNLAYQDLPRDEMLNGKVVLMSPRPSFNHNRIASNIFRIFADFLSKRPCEAIADGTDLYLSETNRFVPDMMIVCDRSKIKYDGVHGAPDLVVEVLSPRTAKNDRFYKKNCYEKYGVREYWLVEPNSFSVEQYLLQDGQLELAEIYHIHKDYLEILTEEEQAELPKEFKCSLYDDLSIPLADIFARLI